MWESTQEPEKKKQFFHFTISEQANLILAPRAGFYKEN